MIKAVVLNIFITLIHHHVAVVDAFSTQFLSVVEPRPYPPPTCRRAKTFPPFWSPKTIDYANFSPAEALEYRNPSMSLSSLKSSSSDDPTIPPIPLFVSIVGSSTRFVVSASVLLYYSYALSPTATLLVSTAVVNAFLGKTVKRILSTPRPPNSPIKDPKDSGMPSSHGVSLGYLSVSAINLHPFGAMPSLLLLGYCGVGLWYRVLRGLHTWPQVVVGYLFGATNAAIFWNSPAYPYLEGYIRGAMGDKVDVKTAGVILVVGAVVVGWREISKAKRFIIKKE